MYLDRYSKIKHVRDFARQINEAIRTYFCGYSFAAVTGLLPVVEGIMRKMAISQNRDVGHGTGKLNDELQDLVDRELTSPHCYGERLVMLEAFRDFVRDRLLQHTDDYVGLNEFNRHGILHGLFENFGQAINFFRLIKTGIRRLILGAIAVSSFFAVGRAASSQEVNRWVMTHLPGTWSTTPW